MSGPSSEAVGESIRVRRGAPRSVMWGEVRIGEIKFAASRRWRSHLRAGAMGFTSAEGIERHRR